jgi:hypothetical protein
MVQFIIASRSQQHRNATVKGFNKGKAEFNPQELHVPVYTHRGKLVHVLNW